MSRRITVVVACDIGVPLAHGFVVRDRNVIHALRQLGQVRVIGVAANESQRLDFIEQVLVEPELVGPPQASRRRRLSTILRFPFGRLGFRGAEKRLRSAIAGSAPDIVVMLTYLHPRLVRVASSVAPCLLFAEERSAVPPRAIRLFQIPPPVFVTIDEAIKRRSIRRAAAVAVIGPAERPWAEERFAAPVEVVPLLSDLPYWSATTEPAADAGPFDVVVIGNYAEDRNVAGLVEIVKELRAGGWPDQLRLRLVSATGFSPELWALGGDGLELIGKVDDPRPLYRSAAAALVPSFRALGVKSGILQGWATGCPVVTTTASASTVGGIDGTDVLAGATAPDVARLLAEIPERGDMAALVAAGRRHLQDAFGPAAHDDAVKRALERTVGFGESRGQSVVKAARTSDPPTSGLGSAP